MSQGKLSMLPRYSVQLVRDAAGFEAGEPICCPQDAMPYIYWLKRADREHFVVVLLDVRNRPIGMNTVSVGTVAASIIHPREVYKTAILTNSSSILCVHNHPSGDVTPSQDDDALIRRLREAGEVIGIELLDSMIVAEPMKVGSPEWYSYRQKGRL